MKFDSCCQWPTVWILLFRVVKLVRALRKGWIKRSSERGLPKKEPETYLLWADDGMATDRTATGLSYVPAPKTKLPGHEESYNPPKEYLPSEVSPSVHMQGVQQCIASC